LKRLPSSSLALTGLKPGANKSDRTECEMFISRYNQQRKKRAPFANTGVEVATWLNSIELWAGENVQVRPTGSI